MKCKCGEKTGYRTVDGEPICRECIDNEEYIGCTKCGEYYQQPLNNGDGTSCYSCMIK